MTPQKAPTHEDQTVTALATPDEAAHFWRLNFRYAQAMLIARRSLDRCVVLACLSLLNLALPIACSMPPDGPPALILQVLAAWFMFRAGVTCSLMELDRMAVRDAKRDVEAFLDLLQSIYPHRQQP